MSIELRCESCGKKLKAPDTAAGKRSKCPACGYELYVPTPESELEELPLAPEDTDDVRRQEELLAERRRLDQMIAHEGGDDAAGAAPGSRSAGGAAGESIGELVLAYLVAMRDSDLDGADRAFGKLRPRRADALQEVDRLTQDQLPPAPLASVPRGVYEGFLKNLRSQL